VPLPASLLEPGVLLPLAAILILLAAAWKLRTAAAGLTFAVAWFFVTILPVANIIPIGALLGERFLYLPSLCLSLLAAGVWQRRPSGWQARASLVVCLLVCAVFAVLTFTRNFAWQNASTLWQSVLCHQPNNQRAQFHLGAQYEEQKSYELAMAAYERAIHYYPEHNWHPDSRSVAAVKAAMSRICNNLAVRLYHKQDYDSALAYCLRAIENNGLNAEAYVVAGNVYAQRGDLRQAGAMYQQALKANPDQFEARENLKRIGSP